MTVCPNIAMFDKIVVTNSNSMSLPSAEAKYDTPGKVVCARYKCGSEGAEKSLVRV